MIAATSAIIRKEAIVAHPPKAGTTYGRLLSVPRWQARRWQHLAVLHEIAGVQAVKRVNQ